MAAFWPLHFKIHQSLHRQYINRHRSRNSHHRLYKYTTDDASRENLKTRRRRASDRHFNGYPLSSVSRSAVARQWGAHSRLLAVSLTSSNDSSPDACPGASDVRLTRDDDDAPDSPIAPPPCLLEPDASDYSKRVNSTHIWPLPY
ncbi:unnamed protein product [Colias eurytheme]|nr:unnamed protein product [Colias eurytheme]